MSERRFAVAWWNGQRWAWLAFAMAGREPARVDCGDVAPPDNAEEEGLDLVRLIVARAAGCSAPAVSFLPAPPEGEA
jgi:hypothetical protein